jgi:hypothetical protein
MAAKLGSAPGCRRVAAARCGGGRNPSSPGTPIALVRGAHEAGNTSQRQFAGQFVGQRAGDLPNRFDLGSRFGRSPEELFDLLAIRAPQLAEGIGREAGIVGDVHVGMHRGVRSCW